MVGFLLAAQKSQGWVWNFRSMDSFLLVSLVLAAGMLIWNTIEVGRNDAANLVNAVFGARILTRRVAVWIAGCGVVVGAVVSSDVIDTARKEIFDPAMFQAQTDPVRALVVIFVSVYLVNTVLLYSYSAFGMPVSTTACLVFALLGAALAVGGGEVVNWAVAGKVVSAIVLSIIISACAGFLIQRALRGAIRDGGEDLMTLLLHGGWAGGGMLAGLTYFMLVKGMKQVEWIKGAREHLETEFGSIVIVLCLWTLFAMIIHSTLVVYRERAARLLFPVIAVIGMICMGFAFGQNDLANCASPGLAAMNLIGLRHEPFELANEIPISFWMLLGCGFLLLLGMTTKQAQRVTRAEVNTGSMNHHVALYAPQWCIRVARVVVRSRGEAPSLAPPPALTETGKKLHYDPLRACVILSVSASVIATASSFGKPVSTTYVAFAAVVATGAADRILQRGDAELKMARTIWVVFSWFASALIAAAAAGVVSQAVFRLGVVGIVLGLTTNLVVRFALGRRADVQEKLIREQARERMTPEGFDELEAEL